MEIEFHLEEMGILLRKVEALEEKGTAEPVHEDLKRIAEAVQYLLETSDLLKEDVDS